MKKLTEQQILKMVTDDYNKMFKASGYPLAKDGDFILEDTCKEDFENRSFHIDNGLYSLKSGTV